jgi:pilus assembly protein Flp/PilA
MGMTMLRISKCFIADESGATAIEYGMIAAGVAGAVVAVIVGLGTKVNTMWQTVLSAL